MVCSGETLSDFAGEGREAGREFCGRSARADYTFMVSALRTAWSDLTGAIDRNENIGAPAVTAIFDLVYSFLERRYTRFATILAPYVGPITCSPPAAAAFQPPAATLPALKPIIKLEPAPAPPWKDLPFLSQQQHIYITGPGYNVVPAGEVLMPPCAAGPSTAPSTSTAPMLPGTAPSAT